MIYKVTFDNNDTPVKAEIWEKLNKVPPSVLDANPNGYRFDGYGWVNADNEEEAILIACHIAR